MGESVLAGPGGPLDGWRRTGKEGWHASGPRQESRADPASLRLGLRPGGREAARSTLPGRTPPAHTSNVSTTKPVLASKANLESTLLICRKHAISSSLPPAPHSPGAATLADAAGETALTLQDDFLGFTPIPTELLETPDRLL